MNVAFLFPGSTLYEALDNWVLTIARHCQSANVTLKRWPVDCVGQDVVLVITEGRTYPKDKIDDDLAALKRHGIPFGVVHNNDNPGVPTPGDYPSFCWTKQAHARLAHYEAMLCRQPVLPLWGDHALPTRPHVATFGHCEPKKKTLEMAKWCARRGVPFTAFCPAALAKQNETYIETVREIGKGNVVIHEWAEKIEDLHLLFADVSHFLFVLPQSKGGTGGSPTSPRYAGAFGRPVLVVDDEDTFEEDGYYVFPSLDEIDTLTGMQPPSHEWGPDEYVQTLVKRVKEWWR